MDAALWEARRAAMEVAPAPGARVGGANACTDGRVVDGRDALLARTAWTAVLVNEAGAVAMQASGAAGGPQTAPRAELTAALWVAEVFFLPRAPTRSSECSLGE